MSLVEIENLVSFVVIGWLVLLGVLLIVSFLAIMFWITR